MLRDVDCFFLYLVFRLVLVKYGYNDFVLLLIWSCCWLLFGCWFTADLEVFGVYGMLVGVVLLLALLACFGGLLFDVFVYLFVYRSVVVVLLLECCLFGCFEIVSLLILVCYGLL